MRQKHDNYLKIDGKPVVFVYSNSDAPDYVEKWGRVRKNFGRIYTVLKVVKGFRDYENLVDSWHQYAPANRFASFPPHSAFASPGYWRYHEAPKLERDVLKFKEAVRQLKSSNVQFQLIETWNEYHEGTIVEPASEIVHDDSSLPFKVRDSFGTKFVDAIRE